MKKFVIPKQNHTDIPLIGLGTWKLRGKECEETIAQALELGYRHIDTADVYENHKSIGKAIHSYPRKELFITSKVGFNRLDPNDIKQDVPRFLDELKTDYIDLLLIHWPNPKVDLVKSMEQLVAFKDQGLVRSVGVSNFVRSHLEILAPHKFPILVNQIEMHPYLQRNVLVAFCREMGIAITAYRPLAKGAFEKDRTLSEIGSIYGKSASQIALRFLVQQDIVVIPKASSPKHLEDNLAIFDFTLTSSQMRQIQALDCGKRFCAPDDMPISED